MTNASNPKPATTTAPSSTADRKISITRVLNAPRELVWKVWTDPKHIAQWWGPDGFTNTIHKMDVRPGGVWDFIMHGPDGTDYKNVIQFDEVVEPARLVFTHVVTPHFRSTVTFEDLNGKTKLTMTGVFESAEVREMAIKTFGAVEGQKQTIGRLEAYLAGF